MRLADFISPLGIRPEIVALAALAVALYLALRIFMSALHRAAARNAALGTRLEDLERSITQLREAVVAPAGGPALHGSKRALALAMLERGESPESVSAEVGASRNEIELLTKVQQLLAG